MVAAVGEDSHSDVVATVGTREICIDNLAVLPAPTYRWRARHEGEHNLDLGSQDRINELWKPDLPVGFSGWAFIGSMPPHHQVATAEQLDAAQLVAGDAMLSYAAAERTEVSRLLQLCDWFFCTAEELGTIGGQAGRPEQFRRRWLLDGLCLKEGPDGVRLVTAAGHLWLPALTTHTIADTTGAGDSFAGGMLSRWITRGGEPDSLLDAAVWGVACASIAIESVGLAALAAATSEQLAERAEEVWEWVRATPRSRSLPET
jgi:sugar/nucleoside kinase (ribokinase family)